jgi:hypothetical protein
MLPGAMKLGTGVLEGVKMGINAVGYGADTVNTNTGVPGRSGRGGGGGDERDIEGRRTVSRSAPAPHVSPLAAARGHSHSHSRRASTQVRSAVPNNGPTTATSHFATTTDGGEWIVVLGLQPLLERRRARAEGEGEGGEGIGRSPVLLSPTSSFLVTSPPLTYLSPLPPSATVPHTVVEFPYTSSTSTKFDLTQPHTRSSPSKYARSSPSKHGHGHGYGGGYGGGGGTSRPRPSTPNTGAKAVASLQWSLDGTLLAVGGVDGSAARVFGVSRPRRAGGASATTASGAAGGTGGGERGERGETGEARLVYELLSGVTPASILDICWSADGLWCGFVSDKWTVRTSLRRFLYHLHLLIVFFLLFSGFRCVCCPPSRWQNGWDVPDLWKSVESSQASLGMLVDRRKFFGF